jgi:excisionase family DNA binding protein
MNDQILERLEQIERYTLLGVKNVLNLEDVALLTGLSKSHLYKLTCSRQIPHYKQNGKQMWFDKSEIEAWQKQNRVITQTEAEQQAIAYNVIGKEGGKK